MSLRLPGLLFLAGLGWLSGCGSDVILDTGGQGGSGGDGGSGAGQTSQGGSGAGTSTPGSGGSGAGTTTPGTGGTGGVSEECSPACDANHTCILGQCVPVRELLLTVQAVTQVDPGGSESKLGTASACESFAGEQDPGPLVAEDGECRVHLSMPPEEPSSVGLVKASGPSFGTVTLAAGDGGPNCLYADVPAGPTFLQGETLGFQVGAGTNTPDFGIDGESPPSFSMSTGAFVKGQPFEISWQSGGGPPRFYVLLFDSDLLIECKPSAGTSLTISGQLTDHLDSLEDFAVVYGSVRAPETTLQVTPTYRAKAAGMRSQLHILPYQGF